MGRSAGPGSAAAPLILSRPRRGRHTTGFVGELSDKVKGGDKVSQNFSFLPPNPSGFIRPALPKTLSVTLVSPRVTGSREALISHRYSPASSWVTLCSVTVAPLMVALPSKGPGRKGKRLIKALQQKQLTGIFLFDRLQDLLD